MNFNKYFYATRVSGHKVHDVKLTCKCQSVLEIKRFDECVGCTMISVHRFEVNVFSLPLVCGTKTYSSDVCGETKFIKLRESLLCYGRENRIVEEGNLRKSSSDFT